MRRKRLNTRSVTLACLLLVQAGCSGEQPDRDGGSTDELGSVDGLKSDGPLDQGSTDGDTADGGADAGGDSGADALVTPDAASASAWRGLPHGGVLYGNPLAGTGTGNATRFSTPPACASARTRAASSRS